MSQILVPTERVERAILLIRGQKVMLDHDLAAFYGVPTKALNQAVRRNPSRFPSHFMFQLTAAEKFGVVTNCDHLRKLKFSPTRPYAFTEHGALMLATVLNSDRAIAASLRIIEVFVKLHQTIAAHREMQEKLAELERKFASHDGRIESLFEAIRQLMTPPDPPRRRIGYVHESKGKYRIHKRS